MRKLYIDFGASETVFPKPGDYVFSSGRKGVGSRYLVHTAYRVKRHDPSAPPRIQMTVELVDEIPPHSRTFSFFWYPRNKKRVTFEQYMKRKVAC